jgi:hypothetical protein
MRLEESFLHELNKRRPEMAPLYADPTLHNELDLQLMLNGRVTLAEDGER